MHDSQIIVHNTFKTLDSNSCTVLRGPSASARSWCEPLTNLFGQQHSHPCQVLPSISNPAFQTPYQNRTFYKRSTMESHTDFELPYVIKMARCCSDVWISSESNTINWLKTAASDSTKDFFRGRALCEERSENVAIL